MKFNHWIRHTLTGKITICILAVLLIATLFYSQIIQIFNNYPRIDVTRIDTPVDFKNFLDQCSLEDRIQLMQSLKGLDDIELRDEYFGHLPYLDTLDKYTEDKDMASAELPLKPSTFNDVPPETVAKAMDMGIIDKNMVSSENICRELIWRRYNKTRYLFLDHNNIDYHKDIVQWVAEEHDIPESKINKLSTYYLEYAIAESFFAELWNKLTVEQRTALLTQIESNSNSTIHNKLAIAGMSGAAAIAALSATVAFTGFAFYTTLSSTIATVAGLAGVTVPFAGYMAASSGAALLAGPVGWGIAAGGLVASGIAMGWREVDTVTNFVITVNAIKTKYLE